MNDEEEICFKSAVRQVLTEAANDYTKENKFTPQILLKLRCVFGDTFESALELYEKKKVTCFSVEATRYVNKDRAACCFYEVQGSSTEVYTIFPNINFCSCASFATQVLEKQNKFTCKHIVAVWLASVHQVYLNTQTIQESKFYEILLGRISFHE